MSSFLGKAAAAAQAAFIGVCAAALSAQTFFLLEKRAVFGSQYPLFIGLLTVFGYHLFSKDRLKKAVAWLSGLAALCLFLKNRWPVDGLQIGLVLLGAAYYLPVFSRRFCGENTPLRGCTVCKPVSIALVWSAVTVAPPFLFFEKTGGCPAFWMMLAGRFCFVAALALGYDILDEAEDRTAGLPTFPVKFGVDFTKGVATWLFLTSLLAVVGQVATGFYSPKIGAAVGFSLFASGFLIRKLPVLGRAVSDKILVDSMMVVQFFAVALSLF